MGGGDGLELDAAGDDDGKHIWFISNFLYRSSFLFLSFLRHDCHWPLNPCSVLLTDDESDSEEEDTDEASSGIEVDPKDTVNGDTTVAPDTKA